MENSSVYISKSRLNLKGFRRLLLSATPSIFCGLVQINEIVFSSFDVRFIAVNDGVDSARGTDDFTPFRNLFNDFYAKDTSKKVRSVMETRGTSGKHLGKPPYGYRSDTQDKDHRILDEDAAPVVKRIFDLAIAGKGPSQIAHILEADGVLTTKPLYAQRKGKPMPGGLADVPEGGTGEVHSEGQAAAGESEEAAGGHRQAHHPYL